MDHVSGQAVLAIPRHHPIPGAEDAVREVCSMTPNLKIRAFSRRTATRTTIHEHLELLMPGYVILPRPGVKTAAREMERPPRSSRRQGS